MTTDARIERVPRPRGELSPGRANTLREFRQRADEAQDDYRREVLEALAAGGSFSWVSEVTGLSTNTLQRWKREAVESPVIQIHGHRLTECDVDW